MLFVAGRWEHIREIGLGNASVKLEPPELAAATGVIAGRVPNAELAEKAAQEAFAQLEARKAAGELKGKEDVIEATEEIVSEVVKDLESSVEVEDVEQEPRVWIDAVPPYGERPIQVTTESQLLPRRFGALGEMLFALAEEGLGRVIFAVDPATEVVLAALSYELPRRGASLVTTALAADPEADPAASGEAMSDLTRAAQVVAARAGSGAGIFIRLESPTPAELRALGALGFAPVSDEERPTDLRPGVYWRQPPDYWAAVVRPART